MQNDVLRLFFALGCPPELAEAIASWRSNLHLHGRPVAAANLHLTLAFLGQQPRARVAQLQELANGLRVPAFDLRLDRLGRHRNGLLYLAPSHTPEALLELVEQLCKHLSGAAIQLESRPFRAHLSLLRHCPAQPIEANPCFDWPVTRFSLFVSEQNTRGTHYRPLHTWPLLHSAPCAGR
ncbi:RNA 2',3'-cyclic phosphodiesterase [Pseudomonas sp. sp1636]|uniref:RNA 2',3'-cyclic phosphodiesterase n=1 Tax=Pseudomonas sp. sp1636 TaxID=3036707 RepID=UPI0025A5C9CC|nr:RNA 2',3'-cyclic phosphodiesterase [Pseudomonas sp. sp1636]MDM8349918.1 RNA 2',3'-cyclic phosphodiesterase [Pseudomonas sp. sp1636]